MSKHTDPQAITRINLLPECIQERVLKDDPQWSSCPKGWFDIVEMLHNNLIIVYPDYQIRQIKEKFGGLRFYTDIPYVADSIAAILIEHAEARSFRICAVCGETGGKTMVNENRQIATRCLIHRPQWVGDE